MKLATPFSLASRVNEINIALMLISCAIAHIAPFYTLLIAYAVLGPAHYLTEMSWLHDKNYFLGKSRFAILPYMLLAAVAWHWQRTNAGGYALAGALAMAIASVANVRWIGTLIAGAIGMLLWFLLSSVSADRIFVYALLVPTIIHVFIFTGFFIVWGAIKSKSRSGGLSAIVLILCAATFAFDWPQKMLPWAAPLTMQASRIHPLLGIARAFASVMGGTIGVKIMGFLSFAYLYHYLNWFSKTSIIRWHEISLERGVLIAALYVLALAAYVGDYRMGFILTLPLSLGHVFLEFPLNALSIKETGHALTASLARQLKWLPARQPLP